MLLKKDRLYKITEGDWSERFMKMLGDIEINMGEFQWFPAQPENRAWESKYGIMFMETTKIEDVTDTDLEEFADNVNKYYEKKKNDKPK
jgi:hypothetical protein